MARVWSRQAPVVVLLALGAAACNRTPAPGVARGEALYDTCTPCHGANGGGNQALAAPAIAGLPQWYVQAQLEKFQAGHRGGTAFDTTGIRMKSMSWSLDLAGDLESVAEFVAGGLFPPCPIDQRMADGFRRRGEKMRPAPEPGLAFAVNQAQPGFMHQGGGLQGIARHRSGQLVPGQPPQLLVNPRQ